jgi:NADP-dependent 3-hydroxy acid dehydrogenase YdfG
LRGFEENRDCLATERTPMLKRNHPEPPGVVITGASSGIGQATAELFARRGAHVVLAARNIDALDDVVARCRAAGGQATAVRTDVTDIGEVRSLADVALAELGSIDVWAWVPSGVTRTLPWMRTRG